MKQQGNSVTVLFKLNLRDGQDLAPRPANGRTGLEAFMNAFDVGLKDESLGARITSVNGQEFNTYHYFILDPKTGKRYVPYKRTWYGARRYLDLRHILLSAEMDGMVIEITLINSRKDFANSVVRRFDGLFSSFKLEEIPNIDMACSLGAISVSDQKMFAYEFDRYSWIINMRRQAMAFDARPNSRLIRQFVPSYPHSDLQPFTGVLSGILGSPPAQQKRGYGEQVQLSEPEQPSHQFADGHVFQKQPSLETRLLGEISPVSISPRPSEPTPRKRPSGRFIEMQPMGSPVAGPVADFFQQPQPGAAHAISADYGIPTSTQVQQGRMANFQMNSETPQGEAFRISKEKSHYAPKLQHKEKILGKAHVQKMGKHIVHKVVFVPLPLTKDFKAAIFDLDGVVINSMELHRRSFNALLAPLGISIPRKEFMKSCGGIPAEKIIARLFAKHGINEDVKQWAKKRNDIYQRYLHDSQIQPIAGFLDFYDLLIANGIKVAVASSGEEAHVKAALESIGVRGVLVVSIQQVKRGKPAPDLFLLAAKRLKVKRGQVIVFEDAPSGLEAAKRAKMPSIALSTTLSAKSLKGKAALVVKDFKSQKLKKLFSRLIRRR